MVQREITFVPGLYKIFDEILGTLCPDCSQALSFPKHYLENNSDEVVLYLIGERLWTKEIF